MIPTRDETAHIYKCIPDSGISSDCLYIKLSTTLNYCKFMVALEALRQLELISFSYSDTIIKRAQVTSKVDLNSAPVLISLRNKLN